MNAFVFPNSNPFAMFTGKFFLTVLVITIAVSSIQWFIIGFLFHKHQATTPATWRKESGRSYAASTILSVVFAFMFAVIFSLWRNAHTGGMTIEDGIGFGAILWLAFSLTAELGMAVYVNFAPMFVFGKCLSALVEYIAAGIIAVLML